MMNPDERALLTTIRGRYQRHCEAERLRQEVSPAVGQATTPPWWIDDVEHLLALIDRLDSARDGRFAALVTELENRADGKIGRIMPGGSAADRERMVMKRCARMIQALLGDGRETVKP